MHRIFFFSLILFTLKGFSQHEFAIDIHNSIRSLYYEYSTDWDEPNENGNYVPVKISYDLELSKKAQKRADKMITEFFKWNQGDSERLFYFTEIPIGEDGSQVLARDSDYITYASESWAKLDFDIEKHHEGEENCLDRNDLGDLLTMTQSFYSKVGFGVSKSDKHVFVVAQYGN